MKRILLFTAASFFAVSAFGQAQIGNGDMENWANNDEPDNWNSFLTGSGGFSGAASDQCDESSDVRPGSAGTSSAYIWSESTFGIIANGNLTLGRVNMGSITPTSTSNYNYTQRMDNGTPTPEHSEALTDHPDSIVFWAKFDPNGGNGNARMKATLHGDYDYRDPENTASSAEVVGSAVVNFPETLVWQRFAIAFDYSGPATLNDQAYILVTFTTNETPGGGDGGDELWIDDVELIYNPAGAVDTDGDGVLDATEATDLTNPNDMCSFILASVTEVPSAAWIAADCDGDGVSNGDEVLAGSDPLVTINEIDNDGIIVSMNNDGNVIVVSSPVQLDGGYTVFNTMGQAVQSGDVESNIPFTQVSGVYFVHIAANNKTYKFEILKN